MAADHNEEEPPRSVTLQKALEKATGELAQAKRRLILLNKVANSLMLVDAPQEQQKAAFAAVAMELDADYYFNYLAPEQDPGFLTLVSSGGLDAAQQQSLQRIAIGEQLCGRVAGSRKPVIVEHVDQRADEDTAAVRAMGIKAYAGLPLLAHDRLLGTLAFASSRRPRFADADLELLQTLADQVAATVDRARLLQTLRENETRYRLALKAGRMGTWETDFATGTRIWSEEGMVLFGLALPNGRGHIGGEGDEFRSALHPDDRHLVQHFHTLAQTEDAFAAEYRVVQPDGTILWLGGRGRVVSRGPDGKPLRMVNIVTDITERKTSEEHIQLLMREISHRSKNLLSVVQAIAGQTVRTAETLEDFETRFGRRLQGLAASHDLLVHEDWRGAPLATLVCDQLAPFADARGSRVEVSGPDVLLTTTAAQAIGLALHELATNAIKYGALAGAAGTVSVSWAFATDRDGSRVLLLNWVEKGGPPVKPPSRKGFGHVVIESMVAQSLGGEVVMNFAPQGLSWTLTIPASNLVSASREPRTRVPD